MQALDFKKRNRQVFNHEPYGYRRDGNALVAVPEEQGTSSRIRALRSKGATLEAIAAILNNEATPTKRGGKWYARTVLNALNSELHEAA